MDAWKNILKADSINWLLEEENPSVRYFTLKHILDRDENDIEVQNAKHEIMKSKIVTDILKKQQEQDYLKTYPRFYTYKYKGLVWSLITLAELGAEASPHIKDQCEYILKYSQEIQDGGFSQNTSQKIGGGRISEVIPCLTGNMVWSLIHFGYIDDLRVKRGIEWLTKYMRFNDGIENDPQASPYDRYEICWGKHTCHMGVVKALKAFSIIPKEYRTQEVNDTIDKAVEFMLIHNIYRRSHNLNKTSKPGWLRFGFPLMYQTDVLEILDIMNELGVRDRRMEEAVNLVISKQDDMGRWKMENTYNSDRLLVPMGQKGEQSKWLTFRALKILKHLNKEALL